MREFKVAEEAKRRLVVELDTLGFPIVTRAEDPDNGLAFDLLSSVSEDVTTGHDSGIITLDLAESDDAHREKVRVNLDEPYRTMLGHFRHEIGHYIEWQHVRGDNIQKARELFGNEEESYADAIERHYSEGPPAGWEKNFISMYATMHPFEDFAETFAHYMHICDTIETASAFGLATVASPQDFTSFRDLVVGVWIPLSVALNQINRSMGKGALYPFVIPSPVLAKLQFVADLPRG
nr:putative zinc-binding metallopeptidase [Aeromicrobium sp. CFBP 8757]